MDNRSREKLLKISAIVCIGLLIGDQFILTPLIDMYQERSTKIEELEESINKGTLLLDRRDTLENRWSQMKQAALPKEMPTAENMVLKSVNRWVQISGILMTSFKPQWRFNEGEAVTFECRAVAQGNIEKVSRFLYELERDELPLYVENVEISANDNTGETLTLNVRFTGLQFVETQS